jgi:RHS repeat-associated protein
VGPGGDQLTVTYGYDEEDRVNQVSRPGLGTTTTHRFGIAGDPELVELPNGDLVRYTYNTGPNASPTINNGALLKREVIAGAQLTTVDGDTVIDSNNPGTTVESYSYTYALDGQIKTVTNDLDQSVTTYTYEYELPGATGRRMTTRLAEVELGNGTRVEYFYNAMGQVTELSTYASPSDNVGFTTEYDYDASGRLIEVTDPSSGVTSYTYDLAGRLSTRLLPNGIKTTWSFDARDRVVSLEHADTGSVSGTPGIVASYTYWYTADGTPSPTSGDEPRRITMHDGSYVEYDYDEALRLTQERYYNSSAVLTQSIQYDYDQAGNRTSRTVDGAVQTYAGESSSAYKLDKVTDAGGATLRDYTTDNAGRVTQIDGDTLTYNASGQLTGYGGTSYAYDAQGQRVGTTTGGSTTHYAVAPSAQNLGLDLGLRYLSTDGTLSNSVGYIYAGENPIARHTPSGTQYYLEDATDSVRALTNGTGAVSESYDYDGFGNVRSVAQPELGYHAAWHDPTSGLIDMRLREYDPQTGRFTSPDPVAPDPTIYESFNPYAFANQNPMVFSDPTGGYTLTEINISKGISKALRGVRQAGIQHARETIKDAAVDASLNFLISSISGVAPGINNALSLSGTSSQVGSKFTEQIQNLFSTDGPLSSLADYVRFEVPLSHINGNPTGSGFGAQDSADSRESILNLRDSDNNITRHKPIRPDIIWGPPEILGDLHNILGDGITSSKTYVITEIKLQYSTLRRAAKPSNNQFKGIKLFTYNHTPTQKVASFLVLFTGGGNDDLKKRNIEKKITKNYGMHAIVTALLNIQSPF